MALKVFTLDRVINEIEMTRSAEFKWVIFLGILALVASSATFVHADIQGTVIDSEGNPLFNSSIRVFRGLREVSQVFSDEDGSFNVAIEDGPYTVLVFSENHLPARLNVNGSDTNMDIILADASIIEFLGDQQYIDTEDLPLHTTVTITGEDGDIVSHLGFELVFGTEVLGSGVLHELPPNHVLVPASRSVSITMNSSFLLGNQIENRHIRLSVGPLNHGASHTVDLRLYTIPVNQLIADEAHQYLNSRFNEMNGYGFYLSRQETALLNGQSLVNQAESLYREGEYGDSYEALKKGYHVFIHTSGELDAMYSDASLSIFILIGFLAVSSLVTGYLLTESPETQLIVDVLVYASSLVVFYFTYPGSKIISTRYFIFSSAAILVGLTIVGRILPSLFRVGSVDGRVHTRNIITPIFNLAKRSLRRRRLRFLFTLVSITLLVTSFVTLTSFSQGFGVVGSKRQAVSDWEGVFIRDGGWQIGEPTFLAHDTVELNWLASQPEVSMLYSKAENQPLQRPMFTLSTQPIFGIVGGSRIEYDTIRLEDVLVEGKLPTSGVLISESLSAVSGYQLGDSITMGSIVLPVEGIFSDAQAARLRDLDGSSYLSMKWVNTNPGDEAPVWVLEDCEPSEQLFTSIETALKFPLVGVQRVGATVTQSHSVDEFGERLALERGYRSYSSTSDGYTAYRLGNYFEGKGMSLVIPWVIVVLNVVVTMLNSLFERRKEIEILSSVGLNPAQVSAIFVAEATITGFIAGGLGYLVGLGFYKALAVLNIGLQVHQKVSAVWSIASIALAISAVLTGAYAALRNSVVITPSLLRRWKIDRNGGGFSEPWSVDVPVKLNREELGIYLDYMETRLAKLRDHPFMVTSSMSRTDDSIGFIYKSVHTTTGNFYTRNNLRVVETDGEYTVNLESLGDSDWVHVVGSLIRRLTMDYASIKRD